MMSTVLPPDASLAEVLGARARRTDRSRLVIDIAGGVAVAAVTLWARPVGWVALFAVALCAASYGSWAWAERKLTSQAWPFERAHESRWRLVRTVAGVIGVTSFCLFWLAALGLALGPIIS